MLKRLIFCQLWKHNIIFKKKIYTSIVSYFNENGHMSDFAEVLRQGHPVSLIFFLFAEILSSLITQNTNVTGIPIHETEC